MIITPPPLRMWGISLLLCRHRGGHLSAVEELLTYNWNDYPFKYSTYVIRYT